MQEFLVSYEEHKAELRAMRQLMGFKMHWPPVTKAACAVWRHVITEALHRAGEHTIAPILRAVVAHEWEDTFTAAYRKAGMNQKEGTDGWAAWFGQGQTGGGSFIANDEVQLELDDMGKSEWTNVHGGNGNGNGNGNGGTSMSEADIQPAFQLMVHVVSHRVCRRAVAAVAQGEIDVVMRAEKSLEGTVDCIGALLGRVCSASTLHGALENASAAGPYFSVLANPFDEALMSAMDDNLSRVFQAFLRRFDAAMIVLLPWQQQRFAQADADQHCATT
jgi:hypothetical protein